jgi:hypothetical protein
MHRRPTWNRRHGVHCRIRVWDSVPNITSWLTPDTAVEQKYPYRNTSYLATPSHSQLHIPQFQLQMLLSSVENPLDSSTVCVATVIIHHVVGLYRWSKKCYFEFFIVLLNPFWYYCTLLPCYSTLVPYYYPLLPCYSTLRPYYLPFLSCYSTLF